MKKDSMKFVIRDDDVNYFSTPDDIRTWYADIFSEGIPVGFAAIPFVKGSSDVYTADALSTDTTTEFPIGENRELIEYIGATPCIEILQHGTTHETVNGVFEYAQKVPRSEALRGRKELERAFGVKVPIFVPPHDWINTHGIRSIEEAKMSVIRGRGVGLRNWLWRFEYLTIFIRMVFWKGWNTLTRKRIGMQKVPAYPYVLNFGKHYEACSYRLEDTDVLNGLEYAHARNGVFVVVTHLHYYTPEKKERLRALIARARELDAEFVAPSTLFI